LRLDVFLKWSRVIPRRSLAKATCDAGRVVVNGRRARAGQTVHTNDLITVLGPSRELKLRVLSIPTRPPGKNDAAAMFETLETRRRDLGS
jgi:ribosomal 50S subunit-recycling heat shock protein